VQSPGTNLSAQVVPRFIGAGAIFAMAMTTGDIVAIERATATMAEVMRAVTAGGDAVGIATTIDPEGPESNHQWGSDEQPRCQKPSVTGSLRVINYRSGSRFASNESHNAVLPRSGHASISRRRIVLTSLAWIASVIVDA
jgi:hypothetical protein